MEAPRASVVVPTHNRPELLARLLRGLESQTIGPANFETIIVDDASSPPVEVEPGLRLNHRVLRHEHPRGPGAARNSGLRIANAPLVAFIDDDCRPSDHWLEALLEAWGGDESRIVQGRTEPEPEQRPQQTPLSRTMDISGLTGLYETCNIAYPRALLEGSGGFDERLRTGEDADLGARAVGAGGEAVFASAALVYHVIHQPSLMALLRHTRIWSDNVLALKLHPEFRAMLVARIFWKRTHPLLLLAAAGLALSLRRRSALPAMVAGAPYLRHYRRVYAEAGESWSEAVRRLPAHALVDAVEVATMVEGTLRHRTLML